MTRKRIALSVPPDMEELLDKISELTGQPKDKNHFRDVRTICSHT